MTAIALYADLPQMVQALVNFRWEFLPLILGLTLFNYFWRYLKWQYYLRRLDIHIHWVKSLLIFLSGLSMAITPGNIGELLKSYLLKTERLTDGIALILLQSMQHTGISALRGDLSKNLLPGGNEKLPEDAVQKKLQTAPVLSSTGDKLI